jgi:hypothetical protein
MCAPPGLLTCLMCLESLFGWVHKESLPGVLARQCCVDTPNVETLVSVPPACAPQARRKGSEASRRDF